MEPTSRLQTLSEKLIHDNNMFEICGICWFESATYQVLSIGYVCEHMLEYTHQEYDNTHSLLLHFTTNIDDTGTMYISDICAEYIHYINCRLKNTLKNNQSDLHIIPKSQYLYARELATILLQKKPYEQQIIHLDKWVKRT